MNLKNYNRKQTVLIILIAILAAVSATLGILTLRTQHQRTKSAQPAKKSVAKVDPIQAQVDKMSTEEKVGQLFVVTPDQLTGMTAISAGEKTREQIQATMPGGLVYFADNLKNPDQTKKMLADTKSIYSSLNLPVPFLGVDEEGGEVARVASNPAFGIKNVGHMRDVGLTRDPAKAADVGNTLGTYLSALGFNLDFAPDADVLTNPANKIVHNRSFGSDPQLVRQMSEAEANALLSHGVLPCLKHFPGHGATEGDTHTGAATTSRTLDQLMQAELVPFKDVNDYAPMIMAAHISVPAVTGDETPASMSKKMVTDVLRKKLNYQGVIITDSLQMGAITKVYKPGDAAVTAINAGCDLILMPDDFDAARSAVLTAVKNGTITEDRLDASVYRILKCKANLQNN